MLVWKTLISCPDIRSNTKNMVQLVVFGLFCFEVIKTGLNWLITFESVSFTFDETTSEMNYQEPCICLNLVTEKNLKNNLEMRGIEPRAFHMQSERSTTELHPLAVTVEAT